MTSLLRVLISVICVFMRMFLSTFGSRPACSRLRHGNSADAFPSSHLRDEAFDLFPAAIFADVRHDNVGVQGETRARAVGIHPGEQEQNLITKVVV